MSAISKNILTINEPSLNIKEFKIPDIESPGKGRKDNKYPESREVGNQAPAIKVNDFYFSSENIIKFRLDQTGFLPTLTCLLKDSSGTFFQRHFPRVGNVLELYIASPDLDVYKPIRCSFYIDSVVAKDRFFHKFSCSLWVPELFSEVCKGYEDDTSFQHLLAISEELKIGFASNVEDTLDSQIRINPYNSYKRFINEITAHSYSNENSFFKSYIDLFYYLNFVDVNSQFNSDKEAQPSLLQSVSNLANNPEVSKDENQIDFPLLLTNNSNFKGLRSFISSYTLVNSSGVATKTQGYYRKAQYYDYGNLSQQKSAVNYLSFDAKPLTTSILGEAEFNLDMANEREDQHEEIVKHKYLGKLNGKTTDGGTHDNYLFSVIHNALNMDHLTKLCLRVTLENANTALYKYQQIPVEIGIFSPEIIENIKIEVNELEKMDLNTYGDREGAIREYITLVKKDLKKSEEEHEFRILRDSILSGIYIIGNMEYSYAQGNETMTQTLTLFRREWPVFL